jgi:hypothetical protein
MIADDRSDLPPTKHCADLRPARGVETFEAITSIVLLCRPTRRPKMASRSLTT